MKCTKCGENLEENNMFCPRCGTSVKKENENIYENPINYNQQYSYGQTSNNYTQQYSSSGNNMSVVKICVIVVLLAIILAAVGFFAYNVYSAATKAIILTPDEAIDDKDSSNDGDGEFISNLDTPSKDSTYKVNYAGFELYIPDDLLYEYDTYNNAINIGDNMNTWIAQFNIQKLPFQQLKEQKNYLKNFLLENLTTYNATISDPKVETIDGIEYIIFELSAGGENVLMACAELNSMYTVCLTICNEDNDFDRSILTNLTSIINTAKYSGDTQNMQMDVKIKATDINNAFEKMVEDKGEY